MSRVNMLNGYVKSKVGNSLKEDKIKFCNRNSFGGVLKIALSKRVAHAKSSLNTIHTSCHLA